MEEEINLLDYWQILWRRKVLILGLFFISTLTTLFYSLYFIPKTYLAQSTFLLLQQAPSGGGASMLLSQLGNFPFPGSAPGAPGQNYEDILKSKTAARGVIKKLGLFEKFRKEQKDLQEWQIVLSLQGGLMVKDNKKGMFTVGFVSKEPKLAADIVNTHVDELKHFLQNRTLTDAKKNRKFIEKQLARVKKNLDLSEVKFKNFQSKRSAPSTPTQQESVGFASQKILTRLELDAVNASLAESLRQFKKQTKMSISGKNVAKNPIVQDIQNQLSSRELELAKLQTTFTSDHPDVILKQKEVEDIKTHLNNQVENIITGETLRVDPVYESLKGSIVTAQVQRIGLLAKYTALGRLLSKAPEETLQSGRLFRELRINEAVYQVLVQEYEKSRLLENKEEPTFEILDRAEVPRKKYKPSIRINVMIAAVLSLFLSIFLAFFLEYFEKEKKKQGVQPVLTA